MLKVAKNESIASSSSQHPIMGSVWAEVSLLEMLENVFLSETDLEIDIL